MKTELLAPAGSVEGLKAVIAAGADAVYIGGTRFGARAYADNPDEDALLDAIDYAHLRGVKVYMTVNTLLKENEIKELPAYLAPYVEQGLDAVLVQDMGVLRVLRRTFPSLPLHASTQMAVTGPAGASFLKDQGIVRVVPARELSLRELKTIHDESGLEVEAFVHGALCFCYSGMCLFSSMLGGRSGNRGRCAQPCRLPYRLLSGDRQASGELLSLRDLYTIEILPDLIEAGVSSLKIEGRMKQPEYAAGVVSVYRKYLDLALTDPKGYRVDPADAEILRTLFSRTGFTDGYLEPKRGKKMMTEGSRELTRKEEAKRNSLYEKIRAAYMTTEDAVPLTGEAEVYPGKAAKIVVRAADTTIEITGDEVMKAEKAGLTAGRIREQLAKTGGSGFYFKELLVKTDGQAFVPMGTLNAMRRQALSKIREAMLAPYRREANEDPGTEPAEKVPERSPEDRPWLIAALVSERDQLAEALLSPDTDTVIAESSLLYSEGSAKAVREAAAFIERCREAGKRAEIALPYVVREREGKALFEAAGPLAEKGLSAFLVRNLESLAKLCQAGFASLVRPDAYLYTMNSEAIAFFRELGVTGNTVPWELNRGEILHRDNAGSRIFVYGRTPLMVTAQCLRKNASGCTKKPGYVMLTDRKGFHFPVKCDCSFRTNIIYNSERLMLFGEADSLRRAGLREAVLLFTDEDAGGTKAALALAGDILKRGMTPEIRGKYTKGHFNRGVE